MDNSKHYDRGVKIFISSAEEDIAIANRLYQALKHAGISPWMPSEDLLPGQNSKVIIFQVLKETDYVLMLLSANSVSKRGDVQKEIKIALDLLDEFPSDKIFIIPVYLDKCNPTDQRLQDLHGVDLSSYENGLDQIFRVFSSNKQNKKASINHSVPEKSEKKDEEHTKSIFYTGGALLLDSPCYIERQADQRVIHLVKNEKLIYIRGTRQMGKTSLLKRLSSHLEKQGWLSCIINCAKFKRFGWFQELGKLIAPDELDKNCTPLKSPQDFQMFLFYKVGLKDPHNSIKLSLFFDEVEGLLKLDSSDEFLMTLRDMYQFREPYKDKFRMGFAGTADPQMLIKNPALSPFNTVQEIKLDDFTDTECRTLTEHLTELGVPIVDNVHTHIYAWTSGHPHLTQRICEIIEDRVKEQILSKISPDIMDEVIQTEIIAKDDSNIKHVRKEVARLESDPDKLWKRLLAGEIVDSTAIGSYSLDLTGAVKKSPDGHFEIRNQLYKVVFGITEGGETPVLAPNTEDPTYDYSNAEWHSAQPPAMTTENFEKFRTRMNCKPDILLMTATETELLQVLRLLKPLPYMRRIRHITKEQQTYYAGKFAALPAVVVRCEMGAVGRDAALNTARDAIELWQPKALIMVGIAFGANRGKHQPADVLIAEEIVPYESQRVGPKIIFRSAIPSSGQTLLNRFKNALGWSFQRPDGSRVRAYSGAILSGEKLIDDLLFKKNLMSPFLAAIGGEMEGAGVYAAASRAGLEWIL